MSYLFPMSHKSSSLFLNYVKPKNCLLRHFVVKDLHTRETFMRGLNGDNVYKLLKIFLKPSMWDKLIENVLKLAV